MENRFKKIDELAEVLNSLQPMKEEYQRKLDKKLRLEFNYNSNHIEGNTLTYGKTMMLLIFDKVSGDYDAREIEEMKAHDVALAMIKELAADKERGLTENFIRQLNEVILVRPFWKEAYSPDGQPTRRLIEPGSYKKQPNSVLLANGEMFEYASPEETPAKMHDLMEFYRSNTDKHPVWQAAMMHYNFVRIHPFDDGNGRVTRLLMNYILLKNNLPLVIIKSQEKKAYLNALNKADAGDVNAFVEYIAEQLIWSLDISIKAAQEKVIDESEDLDKKLILLNHEIKDKIEIIEKSNEQMLKILQNVYYPFLVNVNQQLDKMKTLFAEKEYLYCEETFESGDKIKMQDYIAPSLKHIVDYYTSIISTKGSSYHHFKIGICLDKYKKSSDKFGVEISFKISFDQSSYAIKAMISKPGISGPMARSFIKLFNTIDHTKQANDWETINIEVGEWKYKETVERLEDKVNEVANETFDFIKRRIDKLKD